MQIVIFLLTYTPKKLNSFGGIVKVEYLIIIDSESELCRDRSSLDNFLQANPDIKINGSKLKYRNIEVAYEVQEGFTEADNDRYFHVNINFSKEDRLEEFNVFLKSLRKLLFKASDKEPQVLWDDVSLFYSEKAYPEIYKIENLMRKLITKFMLTNIGFGWVKDAIPDDLKKPRAREVRNGNNFLYDKDFIDLSTFLFDEYRTQDVKELNEKIRSLDAGEDQFTLDDIREFLPKSNWERYFKKHVGFDGSSLKRSWSKLYLLRCKIAHNNFFTKNDYTEVMDLVSQVKPKIESVILKLDEIRVSEEERDELSELLAIEKNSTHGLLINSWNNLQDLMGRIVYELDDKIHLSLADQPISATIDCLFDQKVLDKEYHEDVKNALKIRNSIVAMNYDDVPDDNDILRECEALEAIEYYFYAFLSDHE